MNSALCTNPSDNADLDCVFVSLCHRCPACVDCSSGVPLLRDGYTVGTTVDIQGMRWGVLTGSNTLDPVQFPKPIPSAEPWKVYFAFFCDEDTAVTPAIMTEMHYFTTNMANVRCNHGCNSSACDSTNRHYQLELPVLSKSINEATDAHTASSISHANMAVDTKSRMKCSEGYDGSFCRSCESESVDIFDRMFHGADSHSVQYFKPPGKHDSCEKCVGDTFHWHAIALLILAPFCILIVKQLRNNFKPSSTVVTESNELRLSLMNDSADVADSAAACTGSKTHLAKKCCKIVPSWSQLGTIKTAVFPALKILITCEFLLLLLLHLWSHSGTVSVSCLLTVGAILQTRR